MTPNENIAELLQVLSDRGMNEDAIVNVRDGLWAQANEMFMNDVLSVLSDEDLQNIQTSGTQEEANDALRRLYEQKTGKNMQEEMTKIVDQFATELIKKYKIEDTIPDAPINTDSAQNEESFFDTTAEKKDDETIHDLT